MLSLYQVSELTPKCYLNVSHCKTKGICSVVYISEINDVEMSLYHDCFVVLVDGKVTDITMNYNKTNASYYSRNIVGIGGDGMVSLENDDYSEDKKQHVYNVFCDFFKVDEDNLIVYFQ